MGVFCRWIFRVFLGRAGVVVALVFELAVIGQAESKKSLAKLVGEYPDFADNAEVEWYYNWSGYPSKNGRENIEFVPMVWGGCRSADGSIDLERLRRVIRKVLAANPDCRHLLAFNEPNAVRQSNFSVEEVLRAWPVFEEETTDRNIQLGSPGVAGINTEWLHKFMDGINAGNHRVDFLCVHRRVPYSGWAVETIIRECTELYEAYRRPIWITELELVGDNLTERQVIRFYTEWAERLDKDSDASRMIARYAIAYAPPDTMVPYKRVARPVAMDGTLTDFGKAFSRLHR